MDNQITSAIAEAIKKRRESLGITQEELALKAKLNRTYVSDIERGTRNFSVSIFERIAKALALSGAGLWQLAEDRQKLRLEMAAAAANATEQVAVSQV